MIQHVAGGHGFHPGGLRHVGKLAQADRVSRPPPQGQRQVGKVAEIPPQAAQACGKFGIGCLRQQDGEQALAVGREILPAEVALALSGPPLAEREQAAEAGIGGTVGRVDEQRGAVAQIEAAADDHADAGFIGLPMRAHDPSQRVAVGDAKRRKAEQFRLREQLLDM